MNGQPQVQVLSQDASRELDALIAEKVMGLQPVQVLAGTSAATTLYVEPGRRLNAWNGAHPRPYSTDIAAAWLVVEKLAEMKPHPWAVTLMNFRYYGDRSYSATFRTPQVHVAPVHSAADSPAEAICRAALAAVEAV